VPGAAKTEPVRSCVNAVAVLERRAIAVSGNLTMNRMVHCKQKGGKRASNFAAQRLFGIIDNRTGL